MDSNPLVYVTTSETKNALQGFLGEQRENTDGVENKHISAYQAPGHVALPSALNLLPIPNRHAAALDDFRPLRTTQGGVPRRLPLLNRPG